MNYRFIRVTKDRLTDVDWIKAAIEQVVANTGRKWKVVGISPSVTEVTSPGGVETHTVIEYLLVLET